VFHQVLDEMTGRFHAIWVSFWVGSAW